MKRKTIFIVAVSFLCAAIAVGIVAFYTSKDAVTGCFLEKCTEA